VTRTEDPSQVIVAVLQSPLYETPDNQELYLYCARIDFSIEGRLSNFILTYGDRKILISESQSAVRKEWSTRWMTFSHKGSFRLTLVSMLKDGSVRVGRIQVTEGNCGQKFHFARCDFESDSCGFSQVMGSPEFELVPAKRVRIDGPDHQPLQVTDHTRYSSEGKFWAVQFLPYRPKSWHGLIQLSMFETAIEEQTVCLEFWLARDAPVEVVIEQENHCFWTLEGIKPDHHWYPHQVQLPIFDGELYVSLDVHFDQEVTNWSGFVAIDDVTVRPGKCKKNPINCDFESECLWENYHKSRIITSRSMFPNEITDTFERITASELGANGTDHTLGKGSGVVLRYKGSGTAVYRSPKIVLLPEEEFQSFCLQIWFKYSPASQLSATLYLLASLDDQSQIMLESLSMLRLTSEWQTEYLTISLSKLKESTVEPIGFETRSLILYLAIGNSANEIEFYLDDLQLIRRQCPSEHELAHEPLTFRCLNRGSQAVQHIDYERRCDGNEDCDDGSDESTCGQCGFTNFDLCGYELVTSKANAWQPMRQTIDNDQSIQLWTAGLEAVSSKQLHSIPAGVDFFLVGDLKWNAENECIRIVSPITRQSGTNCHIVFSYSNVGVTLEVKVSQENVLTMADLFDDIPSDAKSTENTWTESSLWKEDGFVSQTSAKSLFLGEILFPTRVVFEVCRVAGRTDFSQVVLANIDRIGCQRKYIERSGANCGDRFDCLSDQCVDIESVCDGRYDCSNGYDERECQFDLMAVDFDRNLPARVRMNGLHHSFANQQRKVPTVQSDHSNKMAVGGLIWISTAADSIQSNDLDTDQSIDHRSDAAEPSSEYARGRLHGFHVQNLLGCQMRLHYIMKGASGRMAIFTRDWLNVSRMSSLFDTKLQDQEGAEFVWKRVTIDLHSELLQQQVRLLVQFDLEAEGQTLFVDDISFTAQCYPSDSDSLNSIVNPLTIHNELIGDWTVVQMHPSIRYDQTVYSAPLLQTIQDEFRKTGDRSVAIFYQRSDTLHKDRITKEEIVLYKSNHLKALQSGVGYLRANGDLIRDLQMINDQASLVLQSPLVCRSTSESNILSFTYAFVGNGWGWLQLIDLDSGVILFEKAKHNLIGMRNVLIPLPGEDNQAIRLMLKAQFDARHTRLALEQLVLATNNEINASYKSVRSDRLTGRKACTFDLSERCPFLHYLQPKQRFQRKASNYAKHPDHTLGSLQGSYLLAGCGLAGPKQFTLVLNETMIEQGSYTISFWYTTFWKRSDQQASTSAVKGGGQLKVITMNSLSTSQVLFSSGDNFQGRWVRASATAVFEPLQTIRFVAQFQEENSDFCIAIDDLTVGASLDTSDVRGVSCSFNREDFCGWSNDEAIDRVNWMFMKQKRKSSLSASFDVYNRAEQAVLKSAWFNVAEEGHCFKVDYKVSGKAVEFRLKVTVINEDFSIKLFDQVVRNESWTLIRLDVANVKSKKPQQLMIVAAPTTTKLTPKDKLMIQLADIKLHYRSCSGENVPEVDLETRITAPKLKPNVKSPKSTGRQKCKFSLISPNEMKVLHFFSIQL
jgi:hypothetical protein